jgi:hypothetical protein
MDRIRSPMPRYATDREHVSLLTEVLEASG